jgi:hypothetical protein
MGIDKKLMAEVWEIANYYKSLPTKPPYKQFLDDTIPFLHSMEKRADGLIGDEQRAIREITSGLRAEVCRIADILRGGGEDKTAVNEIKKSLRESNERIHGTTQSTYRPYGENASGR